MAKSEDQESNPQHLVFWSSWTAPNTNCVHQSMSTGVAKEGTRGPCPPPPPLPVERRAKKKLGNGWSMPLHIDYP